MVKIPTSVLLVRDSTIFFDTVCKTTGKSWNKKRIKDKTESDKISAIGGGIIMNNMFILIKPVRAWLSDCSDLNTGVDGTYEEDVGKDYKDTDEDAKHKCRAAENKERKI